MRGQPSDEGTAAPPSCEQPIDQRIGEAAPAGASTPIPAGLGVRQRAGPPPQPYARAGRRTSRARPRRRRRRPRSGSPAGARRAQVRGSACPRGRSCSQRPPCEPGAGQFFGTPAQTTASHHVRTKSRKFSGLDPNSRRGAVLAGAARPLWRRLLRDTRHQFAQVVQHLAHENAAMGVQAKQHGAGRQHEAPPHAHAARREAPRVGQPVETALAQVRERARDLRTKTSCFVGTERGRRRLRCCGGARRAPGEILRGLWGHRLSRFLRPTCRATHD